MAVALTQVITEDRASGAQVIDGSLKFVSGNSTHLTRTPSGAGNRKTWTFSCWVKVGSLSQGERGTIFSSNASGNLGGPTIYQDSGLRFAHAWDPTGADYIRETVALFRDPSAWYHVVWWCDTTQAGTRWKIYVNGVEQTLQTAPSNNGEPAQNTDLGINTANEHTIGEFASVSYLDGYLSQAYFVDGQALDASYFGFTDPLTNTWRPKKYTGTYGTNGFYLPMDGNSLIGEDKSGNGNNWTPVNFGGSNTIEKATGALPILNTVSGGKVATVGVRTDANASNLVLALPLVGSTADVSNRINSGSTTKVVTENGTITDTYTTGNFYGASTTLGGSLGDNLTIPDSEDFNLGSGEWTFEAWIRTTTSAARTASVVFNQSTANATSNSSIFFGAGNNGISLYVSTSGTSWTDNINSDATINDGEWHHIVWQRRGNTLEIYKDGILQPVVSGNSSFTGTINNSSRLLYIGQQDDSANNYSGQLQDIRIYKGVAKYTSNFIPASTDPDILPDTPSGAAYSSKLTKITDGAVSFDGSGDYLSLANNTDFNLSTNDFTFQFWVYYTSNANIYSRYDYVTNNRELYCSVQSDGVLQFRVSHDGTNHNSHTAPAGSLRTNAWNYVVITRVVDGSNSIYRSWVDGNLVKKTTIAQTTVHYNSQTTYIGDYLPGTINSSLNGFLSNFRLINGTALYTSDDSITVPTEPLTDVTNTKLLCCQSTTSATAAAVTPGSITANGNAVATNFTPFNTDINAIRGQESGYATLNPLDNNGGTLSDGNLFITSASTSNVNATLGVSSGKWYWECTITGSASGGVIGVGAGSAMAGTGLANLSKIYGWSPNGSKYQNTTQLSYAGTYGVGDIIGVSFDADTRQLTFYKNGLSQGVAFTVDSGYVYMPQMHLNGMNVACNFGQKPFKFPPPDGFQPLNASTARPSTVIARPDKYFAATTYTGNNGTQTISTLNMKPDLVWIKNRTGASTHSLQDSVRGFGANTTLRPDQNYATDAGAYGYVSEVTSNGFTVAPGSTDGTRVNGNYNYVAWTWKAGGNSNTFNVNGRGYATASDAGLTGGTIALTGASVNTDAGFSILTFTGTGNAGSIPHGLTQAPDLLIGKNRDRTTDWKIYLPDTGNYVEFNLSAQSSVSNAYTGVTSSLINLQGTGYALNYSTDSRSVIYCWHNVEGLQKFGSYVANNSNDGPYIHLGFRPAMVIVRSINGATGRDWLLWDSSRNTYNGQQTGAFCINNSGVEGDRSGAIYNAIDFLSNGFKLRTNGTPNMNASSETYIYMAWAEAPTFNLYGAQANAR